MHGRGTQGVTRACHQHSAAQNTADQPAPPASESHWSAVPLPLTRLKGRQQVTRLPMSLQTWSNGPNTGHSANEHTTCNQPALFTARVLDPLVATVVAALQHAHTTGPALSLGPVHKQPAACSGVSILLQHTDQHHNSGVLKTLS